MAFKVTVSGGSQGTYGLNLLKDVALAPDKTVKSFSIEHNGTATTSTFSFTTTESGSYHLDLRLRDSTVWSQPNDTSRLVVK